MAKLISLLGQALRPQLECSRELADTVWFQASNSCLCRDRTCQNDLRGVHSDVADLQVRECSGEAGARQFLSI